MCTPVLSHWSWTRRPSLCEDTPIGPVPLGDGLWSVFRHTTDRSPVTRFRSGCSPIRISSYFTFRLKSTNVVPSLSSQTFRQNLLVTQGHTESCSPLKDFCLFKSTRTFYSWVLRRNLVFPGGPCSYRRVHEKEYHDSNRTPSFFPEVLCEVVFQDSKGTVGRKDTNTSTKRKVLSMETKKWLFFKSRNETELRNSDRTLFIFGSVKIYSVRPITTGPSVTENKSHSPTTSHSVLHWFLRQIEIIK